MKVVQIVQRPVIAQELQIASGRFEGKQAPAGRDHTAGRKGYESDVGPNIDDAMSFATGPNTGLKGRIVTFAPLVEVGEGKTPMETEWAEWPDHPFDSAGKAHRALSPTVYSSEAAPQTAHAAQPAVP